MITFTIVKSNNLKIMKTKNVNQLILLIAIICSMVACNQKTQQEKNAPANQQVSKMSADLSEKLSLTDEQSKIVKFLFTNHFNEMEKIIKKGNASKEDMDSLKKTFESKMDSVLSDDQYDKFISYMETIRPQGNAQHGENHQGGPQR